MLLHSGYCRSVEAVLKTTTLEEVNEETTDTISTSINYTLKSCLQLKFKGLVPSVDGSLDPSNVIRARLLLQLVNII